eukprot:scaffold24258_cov47-Attheya_sp.AAC.1
MMHGLVDLSECFHEETNAIQGFPGLKLSCIHHFVPMLPPVRRCFHVICHQGFAVVWSHDEVADVVAHHLGLKEKTKEGVAAVSVA